MDKIYPIPEFRYHPLSNPSDFRIFVLSSGHDNEPIRCRMRNVAHSSSADCDVSYEALSYVWGDPIDKTSIECDSASIQIPGNLCSALRHLRRPDASRTLWADSLCINQQDTEEKSTQVQLMGTIYSRAAQVIMWQGEETDDTRDSLSSLAQLCELATAKEDSKEWQGLLKQVQHAKSTEAEDGVGPVLQQTNQPNWAALSALLCRPYFHRRWIAQEIILAQKAVMVCGHQTLDWSLICENSKALVRWQQAGFDIVLLKASDGREPFGPWENFIYLANSSKASESNGLQATTEIEGLYDALYVLSSLQCFDPRDRLFALLHIAPDVDLSVDTELTPDYTASESEILHRLAVWIVVCKGHTSYLSFAVRDLQQSEESLHDLPSWVPCNLDKLMAMRSLQYRFTRGLNMPAFEYREAGPTKYATELSRDRRVLTINGKIIDCVDKRSSLLLSEVIEGTRDCQLLEDSMDEGFEDTFGVQGIMDLMLACWLMESVSIQCRDDDHWEEFACSDRFINYLSDILIIFPTTTESPGSDGKSLILRYIKYLSGLSQWRTTKDGNLGEGYDEFEIASADLVGIAQYHRLCTTQKGVFGLTMGDVQPGDLVCALDGTQVPWIIRPSGSGDYRLIGECCLEGFLHGEGLQGSEIPEQKIRLC